MITTASGKFSFSLKVSDADSAQKDLKVSAASSNSKFVPVNSISISQPSADGTRTFAVTPVLKEKGDKTMLFKITVSAEDKWGLKATPVDVNIRMEVSPLLIKLSTSDGKKRSYVDTTFWEGTAPVNGDKASGAIAYRGDIKTGEYFKPIGPLLAIKAYIGQKMVGEAVYNIKAPYQKTSLRDLLSSSKYDNARIGVKNRGRSSSGAPIRNKYLNKNGQHKNVYDMFIDTDYELVVRHRGWCRQDDGWTRLSIHTTNAALCKYGVYNGHTFGGIGGTHRHSDWQIDFEAAPTTPYCEPSNRYGSDAYKRHSNNYVFTNCG